MNEEELIRKLNSVGRKQFINYFEVFQSYAKGRISKEDCIDRLVTDGISNENGAAIRCGNAKLIFEANRECRAIGMICDNWKQTKLSQDVIDKAMALLQDCP